MSTQQGLVLIAAIDAAEVELPLVGASAGTSGCALKYREQERRLTPCKKIGEWGCGVSVVGCGGGVVLQRVLTPLERSRQVLNFVMTTF